MKKAKPVSIRIADIDTADERYRITRSTDLEQLLRSIDRVGLLNPPILEKTATGFRIVSGFGRIGACSRLGWEEIDSRVLDPAVTEMECLMVAIADNAFARPLNTMEQAAAVAKLAAFSPDTHFQAQTAADLGLPVNPQLAGKYRRLCRLPEAVQQQVAAEIISLAVALDLERIDETSAVAIAGLFELLRPTLNQQRELLEYMREIAANEETTLARLISEPAVRDIVNDDRLDRKQKTAALRDVIRSRRYPTLTRAEKQFYRYRKALALPDGVRLLPPKDFESPDYSIMVTFRTASDLQEKAEMVQTVSRRPELQFILNRDIEDS